MRSNKTKNRCKVNYSIHTNTSWLVFSKLLSGTDAFTAICSWIVGTSLTYSSTSQWWCEIRTFVDIVYVNKKPVKDVGKKDRETQILRWFLRFRLRILRFRLRIMGNIVTVSCDDIDASYGVSIRDIRELYLWGQSAKNGDFQLSYASCMIAQLRKCSCGEIALYIHAHCKSLIYF
jgi:hypothetical protein